MSTIRKYREKAELTQAELAELAGLGGQSALSNYERGDRKPGVAELTAIRDALRKRGVKVTLDDLAKSA